MFVEKENMRSEAWDRQAAKRASSRPAFLAIWAVTVGCLGWLPGAVPETYAGLDGWFTNFPIVAREDFNGYDTGPSGMFNGAPIRNQSPTNDRVHHIGWVETNWTSTTAQAVSDDDLWPGQHSSTPAAVIMANDTAYRWLDPGVLRQGTVEFWVSCYMRNAFYGGILYSLQLVNCATQAVMETGFSGGGTYYVKGWTASRTPVVASTNSSLWNAWFRFVVRGIWQRNGPASFYFWFNPGTNDTPATYHACITNAFIGSDIRGVGLCSPNANASWVGMWDDIEIRARVSDIGTVIQVR